MIWDHWKKKRKKVPHSVYSAHSVWCMGRPYCKWALHNCCRKERKEKTQSKPFFICSRMKNSKDWKSRFNEFGAELFSNISINLSVIQCWRVKAPAEAISPVRSEAEMFLELCHMLEECWEEILISITQTYSQLMALISAHFLIWMEFWGYGEAHRG